MDFRLYSPALDSDQDRRRVLSAAFLAPFFLSLMAFAGCALTVSEEEVLQRARDSNPAWQSYQEDIKGQVGAGPVAEWRGEPVAVSIQNAQLKVAFKIEGKWAARPAAIPILAQDPLGSILKSEKAVAKENDTIVYSFELPPVETTLSWIMVKFPNGEKRVVLSEAGQWRQ